MGNNKVYVINVLVDGLDTRIILQDEEIAHRFGFWLIGNDYQFTYKVFPEGYKLEADSPRAEWLFHQFLSEDKFTR